MLDRESVEEAAKWNHDFWQKRNRDFFEEREQFVRSSIQKARHRQATADKDDNMTTTTTTPTMRPTSGVSAEEMSEFYRRFLAENQKEQMRYLRGWYSRNFNVVKTGLMWFLSQKISRKSK